MIKFPTEEEFAKNIAKKALDEYVYEGKTLREWIKILSEYDSIEASKLKETYNKGYKDGQDALIKHLELCEEEDDYENEIKDLYNRLDIAEYDKERLKEEVTRFEEKIKALKPKTGWISVSEKLPDLIKRENNNEFEPFTYYESERILISTKDSIEIGTYYQDEEKKPHFSVDGFAVEEVIAWKNLPEPYKEGAKE